MDSDLIIQIKNVSFAYMDDGDPTTEEKLALDNVSFDVKRGEFVAIVGSNGSGKSTVAKHMNGRDLPRRHRSRGHRAERFRQVDPGQEHQRSFCSHGRCDLCRWLGYQR